MRPVLLALLLPLALFVTEAGGARADSDQDKARAALQRGDVRPLDQVLAAVRTAVPGEVVAVELKRKKERWYYELKVLTTPGKRREVKIDAKTLVIFDQDDDDDD